MNSTDENLVFSLESIILLEIVPKKCITQPQFTSLITTSSAQKFSIKIQ